jgi:hypothetical protein
VDFLDADRRITPAGADLLNRAEELTNRLALGPLAGLARSGAGLACRCP